MLGRGFRESSDHPPFPRGTSWRLAKLARQVPKHRTTCSLEDLDKKTCTVKKWTTLEIFYCRWMGVWRLKSRSQNLTNRYNRQGKWKIKHHCHCHAPESVLKVSSPPFLQSLRKEEVPHLVIKMWNQWSWCWSERGFRTIDKQPGPGRCPTGSQSSQAGLRGFCTCRMWSPSTLLVICVRTFLTKLPLSQE